MSCEIIYHRVGLYFPRELTQHSEDLFAIVCQSGSSRSYEFGNGPDGCGRRARGWSAFHFGNTAQVLRSVIRFASFFEGGSIKMRTMTDRTKPEGYIASSRLLLKKAVERDMRFGPTQFKDGHIRCNFKKWVRDPVTGKLDDVPVWLEDSDEVADLFRDPTFWPLAADRAAHHYLSVRGPEIRS